MTVTITRGRRLLIAWALFAQCVLIILAGLLLSEVHAEVGSHTKELATIAREGSEITGLVKIIHVTLHDSRHPSEVAQSVLFQICRSTPDCRIP